MDATRIKGLLDELKLKYEALPIEGEDDTVQLHIIVDEAEEMEAVALLYASEDGEFLRLLADVDQLDPDDPLGQTRLLLELSGILPAGAYCMDPEDDLIYITINRPLAEVTAESLAADLEFLFFAQDLYSYEMNPDEPDVVAQG